MYFTDIGGYLFGKINRWKKINKNKSKYKTYSGSIGSFFLSFFWLFFFIFQKNDLFLININIFF